MRGNMVIFEIDRFTTFQVVIKVTRISCDAISTDYISGDKILYARISVDQISIT